MNDRLLELVDAYLEGRLTAGEVGELREQLSSSLEARQQFWEYVEQHALIEDILSEVRGRDLALFDVPDRQEAPVVEPPPATAARRPRAGRRRWRAWAVAGAGLAAVLLLAVWWRPTALPPSSHQSEERPVVGTVELATGDIRIVDPSGQAVTAVPGLALRAGQVVAAGDEDSLVELRLADGTRVTLGSGSSLRLPTPERTTPPKPLHLERGVVQVQVPPHQESQHVVMATDHGRIVSSEARFRLYREEQASRIEVENGLVSFCSPQEDRVLDERSFVVATSELHPMRTQSLPSGQCRLRHTFLQAGNGLGLAHDGSRFVTNHHKFGLRVWDSADGQLLASAPGSRELIDGMAFSRDGRVITVLDHSGTATLWRIGEPEPSQSRLRVSGLRQSTVSADGRWLAQGTSAGEVALWEADPDQNRISLRQSLPIKPSRLALSDDGRYGAVNQWSGETTVFEVLTGQSRAQHKLPGTATLALSPDSRYLAAYANHDGLVLFDQPAGRRQTLWAAAGARVADLRFSADGRVLLAALNDGTVRAWACDDGHSLLVLETGHRNVLKVTASADLSVLATLGDHDCVKIWECTLPAVQP